MIVVFGSINLDLIFAVSHLPRPGETVLGPAMRIEPGGKGANQAVAAARDGARVIFAGAVGDDGFAEPALRFLAESGVDLGRVTRVGTPTGCAAIQVDPEGRNMISVASGANLHAEANAIEDALLAHSNTLVLQLECDRVQTASLIGRARANGMRIVLNLAPAGPLGIDALKAIDVLVVNTEEAAWLGTQLGTGVNAASLHAALGSSVVVTLGDRGIEAANGEGVITMPAAPVQVADTTAAGDCFTGVLAAALDRGFPFEAALRRANMAAALCCTKQGTQGSLPYANDIDAALGPGGIGAEAEEPS